MTTKIPVELSSTPGIVDGSNATAITIDSSEDVTLAGNLALADSKIINIGDSSDLQLYHGGGSSYIKNDTGTLIVRADSFRVLNNANSEQIFHADADGAVTLYHNNAVKLATTSTGVDVTGNANLSSASALQFQNGYQTITGAADSNDLTYRTYQNHIWKNVTGASSTTDGTERMRVTSGGDFMIGNTGAVSSWYNGVSTGFGVNPASYAAVVRSAQNTPFYVSTTGTGSGGFIEFSQATSVKGSITFNGSQTLYNATSDYRLKENAVPIENALTKVAALNPINFDWKDSGNNSEGFFAHEVQTVVPYAVTGEKDEVYTDENSPEEKINGEPKYQVMDYGKLTPLLVKAIQEQQEQIEQLKTEIQTLKGE